jgi:hypothetical protein
VFTVKFFMYGLHGIRVSSNFTASAERTCRSGTSLWTFTFWRRLDFGSKTHIVIMSSWIKIIVFWFGQYWVPVSGIFSTAVVSFSLLLALLRNIYWLPYKPPKLWLKFTGIVPSMRKVSLTALQLYWDLVYLHPGSWENFHVRTFNGFPIWQ